MGIALTTCVGLFIFGDVMFDKSVSLVGEKFFRLTVIREVKPIPRKDGRKHRRYFCECICGKNKIARHSELIRGRTKSCGCLKIEKSKTHGLSKSSEYRAWINMRQRCYDKNFKFYYNYGGRGIRVCKRWLDAFENFYADMGPKPSNKHSLDRIDNNANYMLKNCRWATIKIQARNKRTSHFLTHNGITTTISGWAEKTNLPQHVISFRLSANWPIEKVLAMPIKVSKSHHRKNFKSKLL